MHKVVIMTLSVISEWACLGGAGISQAQGTGMGRGPGPSISWLLRLTAYPGLGYRRSKTPRVGAYRALRRIGAQATPLSPSRYSPSVTPGVNRVEAAGTAWNRATARYLSRIARPWSGGRFWRPTIRARPSLRADFSLAAQPTPPPGPDRPVSAHLPRLQQPSLASRVPNLSGLRTLQLLPTVPIAYIAARQIVHACYRADLLLFREPG